MRWQVLGRVIQFFGKCDQWKTWQNEEGGDFAKPVVVIDALC